MRHLPRRSNVHRYPVLKWFAHTARKRDFLWSFRTQHVIPAIYTGCIIAFMPLMGIQIVLAFLFALLVRGNLPILVGLQFISLPVTVPIIYYTDYQVGKLFLGLFGIGTPQVQVGEIMRVVSTVLTFDWQGNLNYLFTIFGIATLGGVIIGTFVGVVMAVTYKTVINRGLRTIARLRHLQQLHASPTDKHDASEDQFREK